MGTTPPITTNNPQNTRSTKPDQARAIQLQIWGPDGTTGKMKELTLDEWKDREIIEYYEDN